MPAGRARECQVVSAVESFVAGYQCQHHPLPTDARPTVCRSLFLLVNNLARTRRRGAAKMAPLTIAGRPLVPGEEPLTKDNDNYDKWQPVTDIDSRDHKGADSWVPRHPDLIRLTGKHPFNSEPPHEDVMKQGWLTPVSMHFVRNHGAVPRLEWDTHRIHITGLVDKDVEITMDEIAQLPAVTIPCMISCCGNRRKEVNMLKNSQGFSWGPGAVSVNFWTGARLSDVLKLAGVKSPKDGAKCDPRCTRHHSLPGLLCVHKFAHAL